MAIPKNQDEFIEELLNPIDDIMSEVDTKVLTIITERIRNIGKMFPRLRIVTGKQIGRAHV